ncbi:MAG: hypothetical protein IH612_04395, partial [Desulfofustis sp.]|nr:hypothetical protein [Desulfofustis sp.]
MTDQNQPSPPKRRAQRTSTVKFVLGLLLLVIAALGIVFILFPDSLTTITSRTSSPESILQEEQVKRGAVGQVEEELTTPQTSPPSNETSADAGVPSALEPLDTSETSGKPVLPTIVPLDQTESNASEQPPGAEPQAAQRCRQLADPVEKFFDTLDTRPYLQTFRIEEKSSVYFPQLIQKLVNNPPVVTGETDDLFTILQNTAHFFRIIGKHNIIVLKGILDRERDTFEEVLANFYELTRYPDCLRQRFDLDIGNDPLYQYAGFFLNTMGGRLYLFRRDSMSRMVVNYYAILIIDQANRE